MIQTFSFGLISVCGQAFTYLRLLSIRKHRVTQFDYDASQIIVYNISRLQSLYNLLANSCLDCNKKYKYILILVSAESSIICVLNIAGAQPSVKK